MKNKPIQRVTIKNKELDGDLEVRNYCDKVEDGLNNILMREDIQDLVVEYVTYEAIWGHPMPDYKERMEKLLNETKNL